MKTIKIMFDGFRNKEDYQLNKEGQMILEILQKNYNVEISETPDYIFFDVNGKEYFKHDCVRIFVTIEAICPDFNLADYGIGFEYLKYGDRYFRFPNFCFYPELVSRMISKHEDVADSAEDRLFCSFVYSNGKAEPYRELLFDKLSKYKKVDSGGRYRNNLESLKPVKDKGVFESKHKFSIACENASHPGYHTEKLVEAFAAGTVPIYWGDPLVGEIFNEKAFINCHLYETVDDVVEKIVELDNNKDLYIQMLHEPALNQNVKEKSLSIVELEQYLLFIFEQEYEEAFRRNRGFWGKQYTQEKRNKERILEKYERIKSVWPICLLKKLKR